MFKIKENVLNTEFSNMEFVTPDREKNGCSTAAKYIGARCPDAVAGYAILFEILREILNDSGELIQSPLATVSTLLFLVSGNFYNELTQLVSFFNALTDLAGLHFDDISG